MSAALPDAAAGRDLTQDEARRLVDGIRADAEHIGDAIEVAYKGRAWLALGYADWDSMCEAEFDGARIRIPREARVEQVQSLRAAGLSTRAIGSALGVGDATVRRDLSTAPNDAVPDRITGQDGKNRPASRPVRAQTAKASKESGPMAKPKLPDYIIPGSTKRSPTKPIEEVLRDMRNHLLGFEDAVKLAAIPRRGELSPDRYCELIGPIQKTACRMSSMLLRAMNKRREDEN